MPPSGGLRYFVLADRRGKEARGDQIVKKVPLELLYNSTVLRRTMMAAEKARRTITLDM